LERMVGEAFSLPDCWAVGSAGPYLRYNFSEMSMRLCHCLGAVVAGALLSPSLGLTQENSNGNRFLRLIERERAPLAPEGQAAEDQQGLEAFRFSFAAEAAERVPGVWVKRKGLAGKLPVVIALHGTGQNKEGQMPLLRRLAGMGFLAIAIDGRYHGARTKSGSGSAEYNNAMLRTFRTGKELPFLYDTVWDVMRLIDWLETRPEADAKRIGMIGFSKGGMEAYLAAAIDPRIGVVVPCIGVQSFHWAIENDAWQSRAGTFQSALDQAARDEGVSRVDAAFLRKFYDRVVPGIYSDFDGPQMVPRIAPRPMLIINGDSDARTPLPGLMKCVESAKSAYERAGAAEKLGFLLQPKTGHRVNPEALDKAVEWFVRWLTPRT
jgi:dienelactone hydrolase